MKKFILISILMVAGQAHASKARLLSLQGAEFLKDVQTTFENPAHVNSIGKLVTFEFGANTNVAAPKAEGGIFMDEFDANVGLYLGHQSAEQNTLRAIGTYERQNNPVDVFYAKDNWGVGLGISRHEDKNTDVEEQSVTLRFGVDNKDYEAYGTAELVSEAEKPNADYSGGPLISGGFEKEVGSNYYFVKGTWGATEQDIAGQEVDVDVLSLNAGVLSRKIQNIYYGVSLDHTEIEVDSNKISALTLPFVIGLELDITTWAVVRGSVTQSILLSQTENETIVADEKIINTNDTTVSAGIGLKFNKFTLDGVMAASTTGDFNSDDFLTSASLTYSF
jgi:hypothetical protein